jgi:hypothetical protein
MGESSQQPEVAQKFKTILKPFFAVSTFVHYINRFTVLLLAVIILLKI